MSKLQDKVVIITGSSMGIGKTMAIEMAKLGAKIVLNARNKERLQKTYSELKASGYDVVAVDGDVTNLEHCENLINQAIQAFGKIDVLVNNAGISTRGTIEDLEPAVFKKVMEVNYLGSVYPTQYAIPHLKKSAGSVIFISSVAAIHGIPNFSVYSSSKMALTALAESLKNELGETGVHVGIAYVGFTENDPDKKIYDTDGQLIAQPNNAVIKAEPPQNVAKRIIKMIERKTFKSVFTPIGKLNAFMNRLAPSLVGKILGMNYKKNKKKS